MLGRDGDDDNWELAALAFVDRDGICQGNLVQFAEVINHIPLVEPNDDLLLDWVNFGDDANVPVENLLVVVVLGLNDLVAEAKLPAVFLNEGLVLLERIEGVLQLQVQLTDAKGAPVHGTEHLNVPDGVKAELSRNPLFDHR